MTSIFKFVWAHDTTSESDELYYPLQRSGAHIAGSEARGPRRSSGPYLTYLLIRFDAYHREASNNRSSRANWERGHVRAIWQWFLVQSVPVKMVLGLVALVLSVSLSPLWVLVALLVFFQPRRGGLPSVHAPSLQGVGHGGAVFLRPDAGLRRHLKCRLQSRLVATTRGSNHT